MKPLCIDLYAGLGGWTEGFLAEGYRVVGFDTERHGYWMPEAMPDGDGGKGTKPVAKRGWTQGCAITLGMEGAKAQPRTRRVEYPAQLVIQDVLTIHGSQFRDAACIVASPPCQQYSWLAMPWSRSTSEHSQAAKALRRKWETNGPDNRLFDACFRIQGEASEAAGHQIPMVVENVRGAQPWVGRAAWSYGSFYLWGDVPALMPFSRHMKRAGRNFHAFANSGGAVSSPSFHGGDHETRGVQITKNTGGSWFAVAHNTESGHSNNPVHDAQKVAVYSDPRRNGGKGSHLTCPDENAEKLADGLKIGGDWFSDPQSTCRKHGSRSAARKAASAQIAKIPFELARWIAQVYYPRTELWSKRAAARAAGESISFDNELRTEL